ncbi:MAG: 50S ribosomal L9 C-terminal domain-containing protein [Candidatus Absconditabacteria bacterium]|jgi:ribosomal protein L9
MPKRKTENRNVEVILLQSDRHLGEKYEIVKVRPIFAKNILLPQKLVVLADAANRNIYGQKMKAAEDQRNKKAADLEDLFMKIQADNGLTLVRKANKDLTLYAKVDEKDVCHEIEAKYGIAIEPHFFKLKKKINQIGSFTIPFLYKAMKKEVAVTVEAEKEVKEEKKEHKAE